MLRRIHEDMSQEDRKAASKRSAEVVIVVFGKLLLLGLILFPSPHSVCLLLIFGANATGVRTDDGSVSETQHGLLLTAASLEVPWGRESCLVLHLCRVQSWPGSGTVGFRE